MRLPPRGRAWGAPALALALWTTPLAAQPAGAGATPNPPMGPADIISGARRAQAEKELVETAKLAERVAGPVAVDPHLGVPGAPPLPPAAVDPHLGVPGAPPLPPAAVDPHLGVPGAPPLPPAAVDPHAGLAGAGAGRLRGPKPNTAVPSKSVPVGAIHVRVVDGRERAVPGAAVRLGIMGAMDERKSVEGVADANGIANFGGLPVGKAQAYRVNVERDGARFSSTPFRLPDDRGYDVVIRQLETTTAADAVILYVGATSLEFKEERLKVVQQVRLINVTDRAYVFPKGGERIELPPDVVAFQSEKTMGHQELEEVDGSLRISGSLPPGQVTLLWGFEVPITGSEQTISLPVPWLTFSYRVLVDAAPGLQMSVDGFPATDRRSDDGRGFLVTELKRRPDDPPLTSVKIHLTGIPGPGPMRWIAALLGALAIALGVVVAARGRPTTGLVAESARVHRRGLLQRARELQRELGSGEIGPEYHARQMENVTDELAEVLRIEAAEEKASSAATAASPAR